LAYVTKKFFLKEPQKIFQFLMQNLDISIDEAQKFIDRKRVKLNGETLHVKNAEVCGQLEISVFEPTPLGLVPVFETDDFAVFDKPSGVLIHPRKREEIQTLNDDIKFLFGRDANAVHRIDKETSGLVLVSKNKIAEVTLKSLFENKQVHKEYLALVQGFVSKEFVIEENLLVNKPESLVQLKVHVDKEGKYAKTLIKPLKYFETLHVSLVKAVPFTGRQHQIRAHMFHVEHSILGDTIYGVDEEFTSEYLNGKISEDIRKKVTKAQRLLLHAELISFEYLGKNYTIKSKQNSEEIFLKELCHVASR
jgi:23S rRNA pseudouridine1911/1915/1917 synthase